MPDIKAEVESIDGLRAARRRWIISGSDRSPYTTKKRRLKKRHTRGPTGVEVLFKELKSKYALEVVPNIRSTGIEAFICIETHTNNRRRNLYNHT